MSDVKLDEITGKMAKDIEEAVVRGFQRVEAEAEKGQATLSLEQQIDDRIAQALAKQGVEHQEIAPLAGLVKWEVANIPVGAAIVGGGLAAIVNELIDGLITPRIKVAPVVLKGLGAFALVKWGDKLVGKEAAKLGAMFFAYDAIRTIIPFDVWLKGLFKKARIGELGQGTEEEEETELLGQEGEEEIELLGGGERLGAEVAPEYEGAERGLY